MAVFIARWKRLFEEIALFKVLGDLCLLKLDLDFGIYSVPLRFSSCLSYRESQKTSDLEDDLGTFNKHSNKNDRPFN